MKNNSLLVFIIAITLFLAFWFSYASAYSGLQYSNIGTVNISGNYVQIPVSNSGYPSKAYQKEITSSVYGEAFTFSDDLTNLLIPSWNSGLFNYSGSHDYALCVKNNSTCYLFSYRNGVLYGNIEGVQNYSSRIDSISVSTSTNTVNLTGYWNATTTSGVYEQLEFYQINTILGQEDYFTINATTSGAFNIDFDYRNVVTPYTGTTTKPITANTTFYANLYQKNAAYYNPFGEYDTRYSTLLDATTTTLISSTTDAFNISSSTISEYPEYECEITSLTGCFKNAIVWAFYPSQQTIGRYYALMELIQKKPPIGYFYITKNAISDLSASSTSAFSITIPKHLKDYIFSPIDTGIAGLIWVFFIFAFYKRLKHLQI